MASFNRQRQFITLECNYNDERISYMNNKYVSIIYKVLILVFVAMTQYNQGYIMDEVNNIQKLIPGFDVITNLGWLLLVLTICSLFYDIYLITKKSSN